MSCTKGGELTILLGGILFFLAIFAVFGGKSFAAPSIYTDHLIDDQVMRASNTMSENEIQNFLQSQNSGLANYYDVQNCGPTNGQHYSFYASYYSCGSMVKASKIIYDSSRAYGINPKAILATLQKEQSLVTTPNPTWSQVTYAMGYGCPDSGGCSYPGFFNQVDNGTWQFRVNMELSSGNNYWGYSPSSYPCNGPTRYYSAALKAGNNVTFFDDYGQGYAQFTLPNAATASLYCYTPHVYPGSANQYYSGSYWFVYYFNLWFGSTLAESYYWNYESHSVYSDSTKSTLIDGNHLQPNQRFYVELRAKNLGSYTWYREGSAPMRLGTDNPRDRVSQFCDDWISCSRPTAMKEGSVAPGQIATFGFWMRAPNVAGQYAEYFNLVADGYKWLNSNGFYLGLNEDSLYTWSFVDQGAYLDPLKTTQANVNNLGPAQRIYLTLTARNTGNTTWYNNGNNPIKLGTASNYDRISGFCDYSWESCRRPATLKEASVTPGNTGTFEFWATAPTYKAVHNEYLNLVAEGYSWLNNNGLHYTLKTTDPSYTWSYVSQSAYLDSSKSSILSGSVSKGQRIYLSLRLKNNGNTTWYSAGTAPFRIGTSSPYGRNSVFCDSTWISCQRPAGLLETSVSPGSIGTIEFWVKAPQSSGTYNEYFNPLAENLTWLNNLGLHYTINVD